MHTFSHQTFLSLLARDNQFLRCVAVTQEKRGPCREWVETNRKNLNDLVWHRANAPVDSRIGFFQRDHEGMTHHLPLDSVGISSGCDLSLRTEVFFPMHFYLGNCFCPLLFTFPGVRLAIDVRMRRWNVRLWTSLIVVGTLTRTQQVSAFFVRYYNYYVTLVAYRF